MIIKTKHGISRPGSAMVIAASAVLGALLVAAPLAVDGPSVASKTALACRRGGADQQSGSQFTQIICVIPTLFAHHEFIQVAEESYADKKSPAVRPGLCCPQFPNATLPSTPHTAGSLTNPVRLLKSMKPLTFSSSVIFRPNSATSQLSSRLR